MLLFRPYYKCVTQYKAVKMAIGLFMKIVYGNAIILHITISERGMGESEGRGGGGCGPSYFR